MYIPPSHALLLWFGTGEYACLIHILIVLEAGLLVFCFLYTFRVTVFEVVQHGYKCTLLRPFVMSGEFRFTVFVIYLLIILYVWFKIKKLPHSYSYCTD